MGKAISISIGGESFPRKGDAEDRVRQLIGSYAVGDFLNQPDMSFCLDLFRRHTEHARKIGAGIARIEVRLDAYGNRHFQLHRIDGSTDDISWTHCLTPKKNKVNPHV